MAQTENKVKFALKKCYYAKATIDEDGSVTYATPVRIPGSVALSLSQKGSVQTLKADGVSYYVGTSNDGYEGDFEMAKVPDDFRKNILGETEDSKNVQFETVDDVVSPFALLFEFDGDLKATRHAMYLCYAGKPAIEGENPDNSKTPKTEKLSLTCVPREDGKVKASTRGTTDATTYGSWYTTVYEKNEA